MAKVQLSSPIEIYRWRSTIQIDSHQCVSSPFLTVACFLIGVAIAKLPKRTVVHNYLAQICRTTFFFHMCRSTLKISTPPVCQLMFWTMIHSPKHIADPLFSIRIQVNILTIYTSMNVLFKTSLHIIIYIIKSLQSQF